MSEVIQKQRNQSLKIQTEAVYQGCSYKNVLKYAANLLDNTYAEVCRYKATL